MLDSEAGVGPMSSHLNNNAGRLEAEVSVMLRCQLKAELESQTLAKTTSSPDAASSGQSADQKSSASLITPRMRSTLCGWLVEVCQEFGLHQETLFLGITLTDRFLSLQPGVTKHQLQLVGTACLFIAAKQEEVTFPGLTAFVDIANNSFSQRDLGQMEIYILDVLKYKVATPTVHLFLTFLTDSLKLPTKASCLASYLMELCIVEHCTIRYPPSSYALAAVVMAGCAANISATRKFLDTMETVMPTSVRPTIVSVLQLYDLAFWEDDPLQHTHVVKEKFEDGAWSSVSCAVHPTAFEGQLATMLADAPSAKPSATPSMRTIDSDMVMAS